MISLVQASCANYERCQRGETCGTTPCSPCPAQLRKAHEPATEDLGAGWALRQVAASYPGSPVTFNGASE